MKKLLILSLAVCIVSCNNNNTSAITKDNTDTTQIDSTQAAPVSFFPVTDFLKGQLLALDSVPFTPLLYTTINDKTDSTWLKKEQLKTFLAPFFNITIDSTNLLPYFKETKFNDQTVNAITLMYEPSKQLPDTIQLRKWNVYIDPITGKVRNLYIEKQYKESSLSNGQSYTQQLFWATDKSAKIITILNQPDGTSTVIKEEKIIWTDNQ
jgi:hypothetical protein